jgi:type-F conjugative transfer system pilin assembly protein TrbC
MNLRPICSFLAALFFFADSVPAQTAAVPPRFPTLEEMQRAAQPELQKGGRPVIMSPSATYPAPQQARQATLEAVVPPMATPQSLPAQRAAQAPASPDQASAKLMTLLRQYGVEEMLPVSVLRGSLYVAVSFSMPEPTLRRLIHQTTAAGGAVILRGFDGSLTKTKDRIVGIVGEPPTSGSGKNTAQANALSLPTALETMSVRIAPKLFERFDVREVPAFVLVSPSGSHDDCRDAACPAYKEFAAVQGDVSVSYAMEAIGRMRPSYQAPAEYFRKRAALSPTPGKEKQ